ncbi:MAG: hypothetical protein SNF33_04170 [Candidatus Algichlamydia australiensis]|nr:hypothetical protein [Chlamydiales bacterium]
MKRFCLVFVLLVSSLSAFDKVVIWGYKLHTHTHSYIHQGFYRAFKHLGFDVRWYDENDPINEEELANSLFILNLTRSDNIPIRSDCFYILHTRWRKEFSALDTKFGPLIEQGRCVAMKCFCDRFLDLPGYEKLAPCIYRSLKKRDVVMPWATDLLPHEIDKEKERLANISPKKRVAYLGTIGRGEGRGSNYQQLYPFFKEARRRGYSVKTNDPWSKPLSIEEMKQLLQESKLAPAIQGAWQVRKGYIPCRIFKNLSYGCLGITNSYRVWELFDRKVVYDPDSANLFVKAEKALETYSLEERFAMMDYIKEHHTYLSRIRLLLEALHVCSGDQHILEIIENFSNKRGFNI